MTRMALVSAITTGCFCAAFAVLVDSVAGMLSLSQVIAIAGLSGFLGSLFAHFVWNRGKSK